MTDAQIAEQIRQLLPDIAAPVRPGEMVATWIERAARACGLAPSRVLSYWHRKVEAPKASEYLAVVGAAEDAARRRQVIQGMENEIAERAEALRRDHRFIASRSPLLAGLLPVPPSDQAAQARKSGEGS